MIQPDTEQLLSLLGAQEGPALHDVTPDEARALYRTMIGSVDLPPEPVVQTIDLSIDAGSHAIPVRYYRPFVEAAGAVVIFCHGGGWVLGDVDTHHSFCTFLANRLQLRLVSVDYRLAPEHRFPAAYDDCLQAAEWAASSPPELGAAVPAVALAGDSAGGSLAAAVALRLNGGARHRAIAQLLLYPATDLTAETGSFEEFGEGYVLDRALMHWFRDHYTSDDGEWSDPRTSVLAANDIAAMPATVLVTCGLDPLRDQGRELGRRLLDSGTTLLFREAAGQIHGIVNMRGALRSAVPLLERAVADFKALIAADGAR